jgi:hypothetical protein
MANGKATIKKAVPATASPIPRMRIGTSITIANAPGRSTGSEPETLPAVNAKNRQPIMKILRYFARFMYFIVE